MGYVYAFASGSKDQRDLLGGKGANLAEMTNLGLPVPPGFTITTEACRAYLRDGGDPAGLAEEISEHLAALEATMGRRLGQVDDPLLVSVRSGAKFSMPGHDGDRPQHRAQRRVGRGAGPAERRRALRAGLLPAAAADVRRHRPPHRRRALRRGAGRGEAGARHRERPRPGRRRPARPGRDVQGHRARAGRTGVPAGPARAAGPRDARGLRLLEHRPRPPLPPPASGSRTTSAPP